MKLLLNISFIIYCIAFISLSDSSRVLELSDRLLELKDQHEGPWLIKFYAPWCHHCKMLEPIWSQVAQSLYNSDINVGRVDCTRFTTVAHEFGVSGFPTILFIQKDFHFAYHGDRTREDIVEFAYKMIGSAVKEVPNAEKMENIKRTQKIFFLLISSDVNSELDDAYQQAAEKYRHLLYFYQVKNSIADEALGADMPSAPSILVFKDSTYYQFVPDESGEHVNNTLLEWVNKERFTRISRITNGNLNEIIKTKKYIVIALIEEIIDGKIKQEHTRYLKKFETQCVKSYDKYKEHFVFGYVGKEDLATSLTMMNLPLPNIIIFNATSHQYHLISDLGVDPQHVTAKHIDKFITMAQQEQLPAYGGTGIGTRLYRGYFDVTSTVSIMWKSSPALTALLFGIPLGFLSIICYSTICADAWDSDETDEDTDYDSSHEKKE